MTKAHHFVKQFKNVKEIEYNEEILYNVLMEKHDTLKANNLTFETLDPKNIIAKLYTSNFDEKYKDNIVVMINHSIMQKDNRLYQNIINRVVNDKSLSTCFDESESEYEEPDNTTRNETISNLYDTQSININNKISFDNITLHSKLTKYIKEQQSKDNIDEIVKKKEFLNSKKEEKDRQEERLKKERQEERLKKERQEEMLKKERQEEMLRNEEKIKAYLAVVEKTKTYKRVQILKKNGTYKRLY